MSGVRAHIASRLRSSSLSAVPPPQHSSNYSPDLAKIAASILYRSPLPSPEGRPVFILNAAALLTLTRPITTRSSPMSWHAYRKKTSS
ncbi:hypothetical protein P3342_009169 [Pyrenophora teres f. teres]|nr:hypothetical protein P3342_009169 [Pyrenophora teres f. teres]